jgi:hypothetical protein
MASWPSIPFFDAREGFSQSQPIGATIRTQMSQGPAKMRRRFTAAPVQVQARIAYLTQAELATFETFYAATIKMGSLSFSGTHPITGATESFRFVDGYSVQPRGVGFTVAAQLEILP